MNALRGSKIICSLLAGSLLLSCATPDQVEAADRFETAYRAAMEDGVITPAEAASLRELGEAWSESASETDWAALLSTAAGTVLASIMGANAYRNRGLPGSKRKEHGQTEA